MELRRYTRAPLDRAVEFVLKPGPNVAQAQGGDGRFRGTARDISVGGMFVHTESSPAPFGAEVTIHVTLPSDPRELRLPGIVRWTRPDGMGVQFGLLGARETHAITEFVKSAEATAG